MNNPKTVVVLGKFDGVHIAHAKLIGTAVDVASRLGAKSLVYSMHRSDAPSITDNDKKLNIINSLGADRVVFKELNEEFMMLSAEEFVETILKNELNACCVVVGENFRFGKERSAGAKELKELCRGFGIDAIIIDTVHIGTEAVSSTLVKELLSRGNVALAGEYLGRAFSICGRVCEGKHLGRTLGFPTLNIYPDATCVLPMRGVYATKVIHLDKIYPAITNVGINPTVEDGKNIKVETHIFGETNITYGDEIAVEFLDFIRKEMQFENADCLRQQVEEDKMKGREIHGI